MYVCPVCGEESAVDIYRMCFEFVEVPKFRSNGQTRIRYYTKGYFELQITIEWKKESFIDS